MFFKTVSHMVKRGTGTPNIGLHSYSQELVYMCSCYKFVYSLFTQEFWVLLRADSVFAPYKPLHNSASHNIFPLQPPTT